MKLSLYLLPQTQKEIQLKNLKSLEFISDKFIALNHLIIITLSVSFISQIGDLFISYLKRKANVKDTGNILPGHGGFLDRIDGILFALPFGILILKLLF